MKYPFPNCKDCIHRMKKDGLLYCRKEKYFPRLDCIKAYGCAYHESEQIDLFKEVEDEKS